MNNSEFDNCFTFGNLVGTSMPSTVSIVIYEKKTQTVS